MLTREDMIHKMRVVLTEKLISDLDSEGSKDKMYRDTAFVLKQMAMSILNELELKVGNNEIFGDNRHHTT